MSDRELRQAAIMAELATTMMHRHIAMRAENDREADVFRRLSDESMDHARRVAAGDRGLIASVDVRVSKDRYTEGGWTVGEIMESEMRDYAELLDAALQAERGAATFYHNAAIRAEQPAIRELFLTIAGEEKGHVRALEVLKQKRRAD